MNAGDRIGLWPGARREPAVIEKHQHSANINFVCKLKKDLNARLESVRVVPPHKIVQENTNGIHADF
jgi:hypothetical protein